MFHCHTLEKVTLTQHQTREAKPNHELHESEVSWVSFLLQTQHASDAPSLVE